MRKITEATGAVLVVVFGVLPPVALIDAQAEPVDLESIEAPGRVAWGRPLEGGPITTLFIAPRFALRDAAALAYYLDTDLTPIALWDANHLASARLPAADREHAETGCVETLLRELERPYDLIVVANVSLSAFPDEALARLIGRVRQGSGLLLAHHRMEMPEAFRLFLEALQPAQKALPARWADGVDYATEWPGGVEAIRPSSFGLGRVVEFRFPQERPRTHALAPAFAGQIHAVPERCDSFFSLVAKAARWAATREAPVTIIGVEPERLVAPNPSEVPPFTGTPVVSAFTQPLLGPTFRRYLIHLAEPADRAYDVRVQVRTPGRGWETTLDYGEEARVPKGAVVHQINVPVGPGEHFLDVWLLHRGKIVSWYTCEFEADGWPAITKIKLSDSVLQADDTLEVEVTLPPWPEVASSVADQALDLRRQVVVYARALDSLGRLVADASGPVPREATNAYLRLGFSDLSEGRVKVEVYAASTTHSPPSAADLAGAAYADAYVYVTAKKEPGRFSFAAEVTDAHEYNLRADLAALHARGVDTAFLRSYGDAAVAAMESGLRPVVNLGMSPAVAADSMAAPQGRQRGERDRRIRATAEALCPEGVLRFVFDGAELPVGKAGDEGFRDWLRDAYGRLADVNSAWNTQFSAWSDVAPPPDNAATLVEARAPWVDHWSFADEASHGSLIGARAIVRETCSQAEVGLTGRRGMPAGGRDWWPLATGLDILAIPAENTLVEKVRSYKEPEAQCGILAPWEYQGGRHARDAAWTVWYGLFHELPCLWWPEALGTSVQPAPSAAVTPGGITSPGFGDAMAAADLARGGIDVLLAEATRMNCGIAVYDSPASVRLSEAMRMGTGAGGADSPDCVQAQCGFISLLESLGFQYDFVSAHEVETGVLMDYGLLVLPSARALSDLELACIRTFWEKGGHFIADGMPGLHDEHGVPRPACELGDLFGVRYAGSPGDAAAPSSAVLQFDLSRGPVTAELKQVAGDPNVTATAAIPGGMAGLAPTWLTTRSEERVALLLNHALPKQDAPGSVVDWRTVRRLIGAFLDEMGVMPVAEVGQTRGQPFEGERVGYRYGEARIVGLLSQRDDPMQRSRVWVGNEGKAAYNMLDWGKPEGSKRIDLRLHEGTVGLVSILPYRVKKVFVATQKSIEAGERLPVHVEISARGATPSKHLVHVSLVPLSGPNERRPLSPYARNVACDGGHGDTYIWLPLDFPAGKYDVRARDVLTGKEGRTCVRVEPRPSITVRVE